jgi:hypothetical protein
MPALPLSAESHGNAIRAGLLTDGSGAAPAFPTLRSVALWERRLANHSDGIVGESHPLPFMPLAEHPNHCSAR